MKHELRVMFATAEREHRQYLVGLWERRCCRSIHLCSQQTCGGRNDKIRSAGSRGDGVRVNVVAPGTTDTGMLTRFTNTDDNKAALVSTVPVKRLASPEEIAHVIAFVASQMRRT